MRLSQLLTTRRSMKKQNFKINEEKIGKILVENCSGDSRGIEWWEIAEGRLEFREGKYFLNGKLCESI